MPRTRIYQLFRVGMLTSLKNRIFTSQSHRSMKTTKAKNKSLGKLRIGSFSSEIRQSS
jgi:hypothetical protein